MEKGLTVSTWVTKKRVTVENLKMSIGSEEDVKKGETV